MGACVMAGLCDGVPGCRAEDEGVCGVPSFRVNGGPVIWGQDKLNVVADMLCGWSDHSAKL